MELVSWLLKQLEGPSKHVNSRPAMIVSRGEDASEVRMQLFLTRMDIVNEVVFRITCDRRSRDKAGDQKVGELVKNLKDADQPIWEGRSV